VIDYFRAFVSYDSSYCHDTKNLIIIKLFVKSSIAFGKPSSVFIPWEIRCPIKFEATGGLAPLSFVSSEEKTRCFSSASCFTL
jgi:hypothetical protein